MKTDSLSILSALWAIVYFSIASLAMRRSRERARRYLFLYVMASSLWEFLIVFAQQGWLAIDERVLRWIPAYGVLILSLLFLGVSVEFLQVRVTGQPWVFVGMFWSLIVLGLMTSLIPLDRMMGEAQGQAVVLAMVIVGWLVMMGSVAVLTAIAHGQAKQALHKNRMIFWGFALAITAAGDIVLFAGLPEIGTGIRLAGVVIAAYVVMSHNLIDLLQAGLKSLTLLVTALLAVAAYTGAFVLIQDQLQSSLVNSPLLFGALLALLSVFLVNPLLSLINRGVNLIVMGRGYDPTTIVREYSLSINNIVDLGTLAQVALGLIVKTLEIEHAHLFLVDEVIGEGKSYFQLRIVKGDEQETLGDGRLHIENPVVIYLTQTRRPLTQYDIDFLPPFKAIPGEERAWLAGLQVDVYVPIFSRKGWIGLLALGVKTSGARYFDEDLTLLSTLADQTAVALENARMFSDMVKLNEDLVRAQKALEDANLHLLEMDEMKSAFISVVTHEMRTPFANMAFSLQLLEMYGKGHLLPEQCEQVEQLNAGVRSARQMVDNLVTLAAFLNRQVELYLEPLNFREVIIEALTPLKTVVLEKGIALHLSIVGDLLPVQADRKLLVNAIYQLAHNAVKFTKEGGKVWVTCWTTTDTLCLDVKDTGVGVPTDKLPALWDSFTQAADPLKRGMEGLGLGLSLVRCIIAAHGGQVWAESQEGAGSVFGFSLPFARTKAWPLKLVVTSPPPKKPPQEQTS